MRSPEPREPRFPHPVRVHSSFSISLLSRHRAVCVFVRVWMTARVLYGPLIYATFSTSSKLALFNLARIGLRKGSLAGERKRRELLFNSVPLAVSKLQPDSLPLARERRMIRVAQGEYRAPALGALRCPLSALSTHSVDTHSLASRSDRASSQCDLVRI